MKTIEELLKSGIIETTFEKTVQTRDSKVYYFVFFYEENSVKRSISGYIQATNTEKNAIINGLEYHAFDCSIQDYTSDMIADISKFREKVQFKRI